MVGVGLRVGVRRGMDVDVLVFGAVVGVAMNVDLNLEALADGPDAHGEEEDADHAFAPGGQRPQGQRLAQAEQQQRD